MLSSRRERLAAQLCSTIRGSAGHLFESYEEVGESDDPKAPYALVGTIGSHNVCAITAPKLPKPSMKDMFQMGVRGGKSNPYQLTEALSDMWSTFSPDLFPAITERHYAQAHDTGTTLPWLFTGYGVGGQLAQVAAAQFKPAVLVTFGAPDAGGPLLMDLVEDGSYWARYEMQGDRNTLLPLRLSRRVAGNVMYVTSSGRLELERRPDLTLSDWFSDVSMGSYADWVFDL